MTNEPLSYLLLCDGIGLGGLEMQMVARAVDAKERGDRAVLVCSRKGRLWEYAKQFNIEIQDIEFGIPYLDPRAVNRLAQVMKRNHVNVCIVGQSRLLSQALAARKSAKHQVAVIFYQQMQSGHPKRDWFHNRVYSSLDTAIVLTQQMKDELSRTTVMAADRIHVIPYGIDITRFISSDEEKRAARENFGIPANAFVIGCIGRLDPQKDQMLLLNAFAQSGLSEQALLIIAGDPTPGLEEYAAALTEEPTKLAVSDRVRFLPFTKDVSRLISCFDVFVLSSRAETFGLVVIEAMAAGIPVVATAAGGVPEIIENGKTGLLFAPGDAAALASCLIRLADDAELRRLLGESARNAAKERYDYEKQTERFFDVCRDTLKYNAHKVHTKVHKG